MSQNGLNSVLVTWTPLGRYVTGYTIFYQRKGEQSLSSEEIGNVTRATISDLITGSMYNISVSADSTSHFIMVSTIAPDITIGMAYIFGRQNFALQLKSLHHTVGDDTIERILFFGHPNSEFRLSMHYCAN